MPKNTPRYNVSNSLEGLAEELHKVQQRAPQSREHAPAHETQSRVSDAEITEKLRALYPPGSKYNSGFMAIGRHLTSTSVDLFGEDLLGFKEVQPYVHEADQPLLSLLNRTQTGMRTTLFARQALAFEKQHPAAQDELEGTGHFKIVHPPKARFATVRLGVDRDTPLYAQLEEERSQLAEYVKARRGTAVMGTIVCTLSTPPELNKMLAERIEHVPLAFTLGALGLGNKYLPPILSTPELG